MPDAVICTVPQPDERIQIRFREFPVPDLHMNTSQF